MSRHSRPRSALLAATAALVLQAHVSAAQAADDLDPLALESAPTPDAAASPLRLAVEASIGRINQRLPDDTRNGRRLSVDLRYAGSIAGAWRWGFSDRLDSTRPAPLGQHSTVNSLRELFTSWQDEALVAEAGRINVRQGPAYGYNPTDYFRRGALRTVTTADPVTLRETRMGTVMLRGTRLWDGGSASLAWAPKLADRPSTEGGSADLGATNSSQRGLFTLDTRWSARINTQASVLAEPGHGARVGLNASALATDALVLYGEWSNGKTRPLLDEALALPSAPKRVNQAALGLTWTLPTSLAVTLEAEYNGAGLDRAQWTTLTGAGLQALANYASLTQRSQELGSRRAALLYLSQKGLGLKQLDLTGFVRVNTIDHSRLSWIETRYHWSRFDLALQWQRSSGATRSEFALSPYRQVVQVVGVFFH